MVIKFKNVGAGLEAKDGELKGFTIAGEDKKFVEAKDQRAPFVDVWGDGTATREFLFAADAARGIVLATEHYDSPEPVNLGAGFEISIRDLAEKIRSLVGYTGQIRWDVTKPNGQPRRSLEVSRAEREFGFKATTGFDEGLARTIAWYVDTGRASKAAS